MQHPCAIACIIICVYIKNPKHWQHTTVLTQKSDITHLVNPWRRWTKCGCPSIRKLTVVIYYIYNAIFDCLKNRCATSIKEECKRRRLLCVPDPCSSGQVSLFSPPHPSLHLLHPLPHLSNRHLSASVHDSQNQIDSWREKINKLKF